MIDIWIGFRFLIFVLGLDQNLSYRQNTAIWLSTPSPFFIQRANNTEPELATKCMSCSWQPAPCSIWRDNVLYGRTAKNTEKVQPTLSNLDSFFFFLCFCHLLLCHLSPSSAAVQGERQKYLQHAARWADKNSAFSISQLCLIAFGVPTDKLWCVH